MEETVYQQGGTKLVSGWWTNERIFKAEKFGFSDFDNRNWYLARFDLASELSTNIVSMFVNFTYFLYDLTNTISLTF